MFHLKKSRKKLYNLLVVFLTVFYSLFGMYPFQGIQVAHALDADLTASNLIVTPITDGTGNVSIGVLFQNTSTTAPAAGQYLGAKIIWDVDDCVTTTIQGGNVQGSPTTTLSTDTGLTVTGTIHEANKPVYNPTGQSGYILSQVTSTLTTANRVTSTWRSAYDIPDANGTYCIFVTPNYAQYQGTTVSTTVTLDNVDPTQPAALTIQSRTATSTLLYLSDPVVDTNFYEYQIFYKLGLSGVTRQDSAITSTTVSNLLVNDYNNTFNLTGLATSTQYVANIWAYDSYGNISPSSTEISFSTAADTAGTPTLTNATTSTIDLTFGSDTNPNASTTYAIYNVPLNKWVSAAGTLVDASVFQATSTWSNNNTITIRGLTPNTSYDSFIVYTKNNDDAQTDGQYASSALSTLPNPASAPTIGTPTSTTGLPITINVNSNPAATLFAIYNTTTLNYLDATGNSSPTPVYQTTSTWGISFGAFGLTSSTAYQFSVIASSDGTSVFAATSTDSVAVYTLANVPNSASSVTSTAVTTLDITLGASNNSTATSTYLVFDSVASKFLQTDGTWSSTTGTGWMTYAGLGGGSATSTTGLTANSQHTIKVYGRNGDSVETVASAGVSSYTLTTAPNAPSSVTSTVATTLDITLGANNTSTTYLVFDSVTSKFLQPDGTWGSTTSSGWMTYAGLGGGSATSTTGLTANTQHTIKVYGRNGDGVETVASSGVSSYTLTTAPNTPSLLASNSVTTLDITLGANNTSTTYLVFDSVTSKFLQPDGTWGSTTSSGWMTYAGLGGGSATSTTGLTANTNHTIKVYGRNADGVETAASAGISLYTLASTPTASASASGNTITVTLSGDTDEQFYVSYSGGSSSYSTSLTRTFSSLTCATSYTFTVTGRNGDSVPTGTATASATTGACSGGGAAPGSGSTAPATPAPAPVAPPAPVVLTLVLNQPTPVTIGGVSHTATVSAATNAQVTLTIQSEPIKLTLNNGESKDIDTNSDKINDVRVTYYGLVNGKPKLEFVNLTDTNETKNALTINAGAYETNSQSVVLTLQGTNVELMAVSNASDYSGSSFIPFVKSLNWALSAGNGTKTVYVKFRSKDGGTSTASDSIILTSSTATPVTPTLPLVSVPIEEVVMQFSNPNSNLVFKNLNVKAQQGTSFNYTYKFANTSIKSLKVKTVKQLINQKGKVIATASTKFVTLKSQANLELKGVQFIGKTLAVGNYTIRVQIVDSKGKVVDQNGYFVTVEKLKNKVLNIIGTSTDSNDVSFDKTTLSKIKKDVVLPTKLKLKYSYTNSTKTKQQVKVMRELINSAGKVLQTNTGKWSMKVGEKYSQNITQDLNKTMSLGEYSIKIKVLDIKTGSLIDENNINLSITEK